ncbi:MAG TPA: peptidoglycan-binding protein [Chromatiaceae bacterium]|nr:peptidoglycan-binding protein [Chromatiaceae bacterium]
MNEIYNRLFLSTVFLLVLGSNVQATPFGPSTGDLYESCRATDAINAAYCIGYLKAYRDWYQVAADQLVDSQRQYCEPSSIDYRDFQRVLVDYFKTHPKVLDEPRLLGVTEALHNTWPCPDFNLRTIQTLLPILGYETGEPTGLLTGSTRAAIEAYQKDFNLDKGLSSEKLLTHILDALRSKKILLKQN